MQAFTRAAIRPAALAAAALMLVLSVPAFAQEESSKPTRRTDAQKQEDAAVDKAYRAATKGDRKLPSVKVDPWRTVRSGDDDKKDKH
ncbi:MAG TPA: hypothetical protein VLX44_08345 [Xanthobacteraceae bacterium]|nr:hypothetical protein [Xanthobacteraceae bacterium]